MPKGLLIKGTKTSLIPYTEEAAKMDRFEVIEDVAEYLASLGAPAKKARKPRKKAEPVVEVADLDEPNLDTLIAGLDSGEEDAR